MVYRSIPLSVTKNPTRNMKLLIEASSIQDLLLVLQEMNNLLTTKGQVDSMSKIINIVQKMARAQSELEALFEQESSHSKAK